MIPNVLPNIKPRFLKAVGIRKDALEDGVKALMVVGDNAAGKSFLRRLLTHFIKEHNKDIEVLHFSQQQRSTGGVIRAMMYGSEDDEATGAMSAKIVLGAIRNSRSRDKENRKHVMIFDEPEIGMSEELALGSAVYLRDELAKDWPKHLLGIVVMSHSRHMVGTLSQLPKSKFLKLHEPAVTLESWVNRAIVPADPAVVSQKGLERWREIGDLFRKAKE